MACRGVHFALTAEEEALLVDELHDDDELREILAGIEQRWDRQWLQETDKAWDAIHRCLTDGSLSYGKTPLHRCILGCDNLLYEGDDYIINYLPADEVREVAEAIEGIDESWMRRRYFALPVDHAVPLSEADFEYTWGWFVRLRAFFQRAVACGRAVVFTADQ